MKPKSVPSWISAVDTDGGGMLSPLTMKVYNRTGGATVARGLYQFDMGYTAGAETTANTKGVLLPAVANGNWADPTGFWSNIVTPNASFTGHGYFCLAKEAVGDNEELEVDVICDDYMVITAHQGYAAAFSTATWTESSKTLTLAGAFATFVAAPAGATAVEFVATGGTDVTPGTYTIASKTSANAIVLATSLSATAGDLATGDIAGYIKITFAPGSKIEGNTTAGGNLTNATSANRRIAWLKESTALRADQVATGQKVRVLFNGFGLGERRV